MGNNEIHFKSPRQLQPRISMPQLNFNASMMQGGNFEQQYQSNYMPNVQGGFGQNPHRHPVNSSRNLNNYKSNKNFNTFGATGGHFMGNKTTRYPSDFFNHEDQGQSGKQLVKSKSQKRKIMKKGSKKGGKGGKTKNQSMMSLEVKFGALLGELKEDAVVDMNMENANISDLEVRALGQILSQSKKLRKISFKRNNITDRGVSYLCKSLISSNLEFLDLSYNRISPKSFGDFKKYKNKNSKIRCIVLRNNDIPTSIKRKKIVEFQKIGLNFDF